MRKSHTAIIERNKVWTSSFETEPYEAAWASEAIFFVRILEASGLNSQSSAAVHISPDGMNWCSEGTNLDLGDGPGMVFVRIEKFGAYLKLAGKLPDGAELKVIVYLVLKE